MTSSGFCQLLKSEPLRAREFANFLVELKGRTWKSEKDMLADKNVIDACRMSDLEPAAFPRVLRRAVTSAVITPRGLARIVRAFGYKSITDLAQDFDCRRQSPGGLSNSLKRAKFQLGPGGSFILARGTHFTGQSGTEYEIVERFDRTHTRGDSYKAKTVGRNVAVFLKTLTLNQDLGVLEIDKRVKKFDSFFGREQSSLENLADVPGVARFRDYTLLDLQIERDRIHKVPVLVQDFVIGHNLADAFADDVNGNSKKTFEGMSSGELWIQLARQILRITGDTHAKGIRHGNICPSNLMLSKNRVVLVDFGQSGMIRPAPHGTTMEDDEDLYRAPERYNSSLPTEISSDIYSVGGVLLWLASGLDPRRGGILESTALKDFVFASIRKELRDYNEGIGYVICQCLQYRPRDRASHAEDAIRTIDLFENINGRRAIVPSNSMKRDAEQLAKAAGELPPHPLFTQLVQRDISYILRRLRDTLLDSRAEVTGNRDDIISSLLNYLSILAPGDQYLTITTVRFWNAKNLGIDGRFLSANKLLAMRGVRIRRVFVITKDEVAEFKNIAIAQARIVKELADNGVATDDASLDGPGYFVGVRVETEDEQKEIMRGGYHIGLIQKQQEGVSLSFQEDSDGLIRKLFVWNVDAATMLSRKVEMVESLAKATSITQFVDNEY